jgi:hypothetical protein
MLGVAAATRYPDGSAVQIRLGVHSGPINTGLVGSKAVKFTLMGETVDVARQLAATGCPMAVHVSEAVHGRLQAAQGGAIQGSACIPWTLQRLGYAHVGSGQAGAGAPAAAAAAPAVGRARADAAAAGQQAEPSAAGAPGQQASSKDDGSSGSGPLARPEQTYLLPTRYASPVAPPLHQQRQAGPTGRGGGKDGPVVSVALDTPDVSDRGGPSSSSPQAPGAAAAAAAAAAARGGAAAWGSAGRLRQGPAEVQWLQVRGGA